MYSINELAKLENKTALITGGFGKIGSIIGETLVELGAELIIVDLPNYNKEECSLYQKYIENITIFECDLEQEQERNKLIYSINERYKNLDILVNNAAFLGGTNLDGWVTDIEHQSLATWRRALEVNLTCPFHLTQGFLPLLKNSTSPSVINIASIYGIVGPNWDLYDGTSMGNPAAYAASKGGLIQLTRWLSTTLAPKIRVNAVAPGGLYRDQPESFVAKYEARTPLKKMAKEEYIKGTIAYLASNLSEYVTGQTLVVDGGFCSW
jgi:NAD(P)-dependent dehydrogenase (short-subunit alcohol dehydrogenase family)